MQTTILGIVLYLIFCFLNIFVDLSNLLPIRLDRKFHFRWLVTSIPDGCLLIIINSSRLIVGHFHCWTSCRVNEVHYWAWMRTTCTCFCPLFHTSLKRLCFDWLSINVMLCKILLFYISSQSGKSSLGL